MGVKDARRLGVVEAAMRGKITTGEGAEALGLSARQFRRLRRRVEREGARGVIHGNRGRPSAQRLEAAIRQRIEALLRGEVRLNDCHLRDLLAEDGVTVSADSVRRIRRHLGLPPKQRRRPVRHRRRRERAARRGAMVLIDGSPFRWLGLAGAELTLVGTMDDATGEILALVLRADLWRTLQDRLAAELALQHITTLAVAQAFLPGFIARYNRQLARAPREPLGVWRPAPRQLDRVLACRYLRVVARDNTVSIPGCVLDLPPGPHRSSHHGRAVEVRELLDGRLLVLQQGRVLLKRSAPPGPFTLTPRGSARAKRPSRRNSDLATSPRIADRRAARVQSQAKTARIARPHATLRPPANHPWRKGYPDRQRRAQGGT